MHDPANVPNLCGQILHVASTSFNLEMMLTRIAEVLGKAFRADGCTIALSEAPSSSAPTVCWFSDMQPASIQYFERSIINFAEWDTETVFASDIDIELIKTDHDSKVKQLIEVWQEVQSINASVLKRHTLIGAAAQFQGQVNGLISLMHSHSHVWVDREIAGLQTVSHQVAIAISQFQLQKQLNKQLEYQAVVNQLTMAIRNSADLNQVLKIATEDTARALQVHRGMLLRLKYWDPLLRNRIHEQQLPKIRVNVACEWINNAATTTTEQEQSSLTNSNGSHILDSELSSSFWMSECALCQYAFIHSATPVLGINPQKLPGRESGLGIAPIFNSAEMPALFLIPLESQGTILGFLVFQHSQARSWKPEEVELVKLVSAQVSTAIIQTETLRQVQALVEKRTAELRESLSVQAKLYERTRQQLDQLRHLNQLKDEFLSTVSHELRTPLTSMTMAIRMLRQAELSEERSLRYLDILEHQCAQETNLINDLLALQELESKQMPFQLQEISLKDVIKELTVSFTQKWAAKGLTLDIRLPKRSLKLQSDQDSLNRILLELLTNAGKYSEPNSCVSLTVDQNIEQSSNQVVLKLCNYGPGIASTELPHVFDKFRRCQGATQNAIQGTGLGLALVKSLVQHLNGSITASSKATESDQSWETCFTLTLPQTFNSIRP